MADLVSRLNMQSIDTVHNRSVHLTIKFTVSDYEMSFIRP